MSDCLAAAPAGAADSSGREGLPAVVVVVSAEAAGDLAAADEEIFADSIQGNRMAQSSGQATTRG